MADHFHFVYCCQQDRLPVFQFTHYTNGSGIVTPGRHPTHSPQASTTTMVLAAATSCAVTCASTWSARRATMAASTGEQWVRDQKHCIYAALGMWFRPSPTPPFEHYGDGASRLRPAVGTVSRIGRTAASSMDLTTHKDAPSSRPRMCRLAM